MQLTIYMTDGRPYRFTIAEGQASTEFLGSIKYWEVFDRPILRIHNRSDTWAFNPNDIEKIHFLTEEDPGWRPPENILSTKCISLESYQRKLALLDAAPPLSDQSFEEGKVLEAALRITLASGAVEYFELILMLKQRREQMMNLYYAFNKISYTIPCEDHGFILLNPKNISCIHIHPGPPEDQYSAWLVDEFVEVQAESKQHP